MLKKVLLALGLVLLVARAGGRHARLHGAVEHVDGD
jgi:hypothetical protein